MLLFPKLFGQCAQATMPLVFDESLSIMQQVAFILGQIKEIKASGATRADLQALVDAINDDQDQQTSNIESYVDSEIDALTLKLDDQLHDLGVAEIAWDVTQGKVVSSKEAMRNLFNDVTLHSLTVDGLAATNQTVDTLAECGLNVRGVAVYSGALAPEMIPEGVYVDGESNVYPLTVEILGKAQVENRYVVENDVDNAEAETLTSEELASAVVEKGKVRTDGDA